MAILLMFLQLGNKKARQKLYFTLTAFLLLFSNQSLFSQYKQNADSPEIGLIKQLSDFRAKLMLKDKTGLELFVGVYSKWKKLEPVEEKFDKILSALHFHIFNSTEPIETIVEYGKNIDRKSKLCHSLTAEEVLLFFENYALYLLISNGELKSEYPFELQPELILKELGFYNIKPNYSIAEIGAGSGYFGFILNMLNMKLKIYINELNQNNLISSASLMDTTFNHGNKIYYTLGDKKNININDSLDLIIIRNSFHHFEHKNNMLQSIHKQLKLNGNLYISEPIYNKTNLKEICPSLLEEKDLLYVLYQNKFKLVDQLTIEESQIYKFQKL